MQAGFLKSSAKVTLHPRPIKKSPFAPPPLAGYGQGKSIAAPTRSHASPGLTTGTPPHSQSQGTWICIICSFSNPVPSNFDPTTASSGFPLPPCLSCGIKPSFPHVLKAAISAASGRRNSPAPAAGVNSSHAITEDVQARTYSYGPTAAQDPFEIQLKDQQVAQSGIQCPRCTFLNHASLLACELCGSPLVPSQLPLVGAPETAPFRAESPGLQADGQTTADESELENIKFSFRAGGEKLFYERLKGALTQRKWLLQSAPPIPAPVDDLPAGTTESSSRSFSNLASDRTNSPGIAGLERRGLELRQKNELVIGSAFSDLDALRASAKEIIALAESFATQSASSNSIGGSTDATQLIAESAKALDMVTTRDIAGGKGDGSLYLSEMSRNLAEYLTDDAKGVLKREGGIMSLVDLWAVYNRARSEGGVDFVSPAEFEKVARLWEKLRLPVRLRQFKSGLSVVQQADRTDDKTIAQLLGWLQELHATASSSASAAEGPANGSRGWDVEAFGKGVTAQETAQRFGWSVGVASEELEMAEEKGALCRDGEETVGAVTFWENWIVDLGEGEDENDAAVQLFDRDAQHHEDNETILQNLRDSGLV